jgi:hypothetical protein
LRKEGSHPKNSHENAITEFQATALVLLFLFPFLYILPPFLSSLETLAFKGDNSAYRKKVRIYIKEKNYFKVRKMYFERNLFYRSYDNACHEVAWIVKKHIVVFFSYSM